MNNKVIGLILAAGALGGMAAIETAPVSAAVITESATATGGGAQLSVTFGSTTAKGRIIMSIYYPGVNGETATYSGQADVTLKRTSATRTESVYEGRVTVPITCSASTGSADTSLRLVVSPTGAVTITIDVAATAEGTTSSLSGTDVTTTAQASGGEFVELVNGGGAS